MLPVRFVVNTHYHLDHVAGNGVFTNAGAVVVAQRNVRDWIHTENLRLLGPQITPEQKALTEAFVAPTVGFDQNINLYLGSRRIQVLSLPGHTGGDSIVVIPDSKIVFGGDLLFHNMLPTLIDASTQAWIETLDLLLTQHADHTFVPGHGDVGKAQDVAAFREYLMLLRGLVKEAQAQGQSGDAVAAAVMPALKEKYRPYGVLRRRREAERPRDRCRAARQEARSSRALIAVSKRYFWNAARSLNSTMMNSASSSVFSGRCTLPSLHPSAPAGTEAGSVVPSGIVKFIVWSVRKIAQPGRWRCITDFSPGPYFTRRNRATSFSNDDAVVLRIRGHGVWIRCRRAAAPPAWTTRRRE